MSYLSRLPMINYPDPRDPSKVVRMRDISFSFDLIERKLKPEYFRSYNLNDGERPEMVSNAVYNDPNYHWIVLLVNDVVDPHFEWFKTQEQVREMAEDIYDDINAIHHYELENGDRTTEDDFDGVPVTNLQFELDENEKLREIRVLKPIYLQQFLTQFEKAVNRG